jgi:hypothetical protein
MTAADVIHCVPANAQSMVIATENRAYLTLMQPDAGHPSTRADPKFIGLFQFRLLPPVGMRAEEMTFGFTWDLEVLMGRIDVERWTPSESVGHGNII